MESGAGLSADAMTARVLQVRNRFTEASTLLANAAIAAHTRRFTSRLEEIAGLQAQDLVRRGERAAALELAQRHQLAVATAKALSAQGHPQQALPLLVSYRARMEQAGRGDEALKAMLSQAMAARTGQPGRSLGGLERGTAAGRAWRLRSELCR